MHETERDFRMGRFDMSHKKTGMERQVNGRDLSSKFCSCTYIILHLKRQKAESHKLNQVLFNIINEVFVLYE